MPTKTANYTETEQREKTQESSRSGGYYMSSEPCTVVLFGASGDLAKRKVIPRPVLALAWGALYTKVVPRASWPGLSRPSTWFGASNACG